MKYPSHHPCYCLECGKGFFDPVFHPGYREPVEYGDRRESVTVPDSHLSPCCCAGYTGDFDEVRDLPRYEADTCEGCSNVGGVDVGPIKVYADEYTVESLCPACYALAKSPAAFPSIHTRQPKQEAA